MTFNRVVPARWTILACWCTTNFTRALISCRYPPPHIAWKDAHIRRGRPATGPAPCHFYSRRACTDLEQTVLGVPACTGTYFGCLRDLPVALLPHTHHRTTATYFAAFLTEACTTPPHFNCLGLWVLPADICCSHADACPSPYCACHRHHSPAWAGYTTAPAPHTPAVHRTHSSWTGLPHTTLFGRFPDHPDGSPAYGG